MLSWLKPLLSSLQSRSQSAKRLIPKELAVIRRPGSCKLYAIADVRVARVHRLRRLEQRRTRTPGISQERFSYTGPSGSVSRNQNCRSFIESYKRHRMWPGEHSQDSTFRYRLGYMYRIETKDVISRKIPSSVSQPASKPKLLSHGTGKLLRPIGEHLNWRHGGELEGNIQQESLSVAGNIVEVPGRAGQRTRGVE